MGFNSVLFICNDAINEIEKDPAGWWQKAWHHLNFLGKGDGTFGFGNHANGFQAVWCQHADTLGVIVVGANYAEAMTYFPWHRGMSEEERNLKALQSLADKLGYRIVKKVKHGS